MGIVDDRGEEVGRHNDREVGAQPVHRGVVGGVEADEQVGVSRCIEPAHEPEDRVEVLGTELARAAGAVREARQPDRFGRGGHAASLRVRTQVTRRASTTEPAPGMNFTSLPVWVAWM